MEGAERKEDAVCTSDNYVSPYLLRPHISYAEVMRAAAVKTAQATGGDGSVVSCVATNPADDEGAASRVPKRDRRREGEARRQPRLHPP